MAGLPRFPRLYGRDGLIAAWQLLAYDPHIARDTLDTLADHRGREENWFRDEAPGKIPHEVPRNWRDHLRLLITWGGMRHFPYYGSIDATPLWLYLLGEYVFRTGDKAFLEKMNGATEAAMRWVLEYGDRDNDSLLEYKRKNVIAGLRHHVWKDGVLEARHYKMKPPIAAIEVQGYVYAAIEALKRAFERVGKPWHFDAVEAMATRIRGKLERNFWRPEGNYFTHALDNKKQPVDIVTSNPGHLLFAGVVDQHKAGAIAKRLFADDMITEYGVRTHATTSPGFHPRAYHRGAVWPHDNWIIHEGLRRYGFYDEAATMRSMILRAYDELGEAYEFWTVDLDGALSVPRKSAAPQAWSVGALLNFLEYE